MLALSSIVPDSDDDQETANPLQFGLLFASLVGHAQYSSRCSHSSWFKTCLPHTLQPSNMRAAAHTAAIPV